MGTSHLQGGSNIVENTVGKFVRVLLPLPRFTGGALQNSRPFRSLKVCVGVAVWQCGDPGGWREFEGVPDGSPSTL